MLQPERLIRRVIQTLEDTGIEYMVTGSVVSSLQGEPRSTHDIDLVVALRKSAVQKLVEAFPSPDFYLSEPSMLDAINTGGMFNIIDTNEGDKIDFWMLTDEPFDHSRFSRKYAEDVMGFSIQVSSPEDTILAKLRWAQLSGGSEKQFADALRVYEVQYRKLDLDYLTDWAETLNVESALKRLQDAAQVL
jgi:hypothetical protein